MAGLCEIALKDPDLVKDERFSSSTRSGKARITRCSIGAAFKQFDRDTVIKKLSAAGVAYGDSVTLTIWQDIPSEVSRYRGRGQFY